MFAFVLRKVLRGLLEPFNGDRRRLVESCCRRPRD